MWLLGESFANVVQDGVDTVRGGVENEVEIAEVEKLISIGDVCDDYSAWWTMCRCVG